MCRSASEYPPNGKRCGLGAHMTEAEREERRLRRNAREKELYYIRKERANGREVAAVAAPVLLTPETFLEVIEKTLGDAENFANQGTSVKYPEQHASLISLSKDNVSLAGGETNLDNVKVSTDASRQVTAHIISELQDDLAYQKIVSEDPNFSVRSVNDVRRVFLEDGTVGYFKNYSSAVTDYYTHSDYGHDVLESFNNEVVAYRLCTIMGEGYSHLVPKTVFREYDGMLGTLQAEAKGEFGLHSPWGESGDDCSPSALRKAALFEYLAGSQDRHSGNYAVINNGGNGRNEVTLIDNGFAFPNHVDTSYNALQILSLAFEQNNSIIHLESDEIDMIQRVKKSAEDGELSLLLSADQSKFMIDRIDALLKEGSLSNSNCTMNMKW